MRALRRDADDRLAGHPPIVAYARLCCAMPCYAGLCYAMLLQVNPHIMISRNRGAELGPSPEPNRYDPNLVSHDATHCLATVLHVQCRYRPLPSHRVGALKRRAAQAKAILGRRIRDAHHLTLSSKLPLQHTSLHISLHTFTPPFTPPFTGCARWPSCVCCRRCAA